MEIETVQNIVLIGFGIVIGLTYLASRILEEDSKRLEALQNKNEAS